jgi:hypothetical protein
MLPALFLPVCIGERIEFPHLWMIHQRLDYCQDNFLLLPFGLALFFSAACSNGLSHYARLQQNLSLRADPQEKVKILLSIRDI